MANEMRLIDANALMKQFYNYYDCVNEFTSKNGYRGDTLMDYEVADMIYDCIDNAPTVDAKPVVHGRWCKDGDWLICLNCESEINVKNSLGVENRKNYCPNCGAKMDGDGNA